MDKDKALLVLLGVLAKIMYLVIRLFFFFVLFLPTIALVYLLYQGFTGSAWAWLALIGAFLVGLVSLNSGPNGTGNKQYVGFSGLMNRTIDRFIAWIGCLKYFTSPSFGVPFCVVEDPGGYHMNALDIREVTDAGSPFLLQTGDILLRGFKGFVDGKFISMAGNSAGLGKHFSHAAIYLGEITQLDRPIVARRLKMPNDQGEWVDATKAQKEAVRNDSGYFQPGRQMVVHSMGKGVFVEDILTFMRCDYLIAIRVKDAAVRLGVARADGPRLVRDEDLGDDAREIVRKLQAGEDVPRDEIIRAVRASALGRIGSCYDFQFNDCKTFHRFSCSEFAYYCYKGIHDYLGLKLQKHGLGPLFIRESITPPDIYVAAKDGAHLEVVWMNRALR